ncbi:MAG: hypothetical protein ACKOZW_12265, partial [Cyanobium sp.]
MTARAVPAGLDVGLALRDGWRGFQRAPGRFVAFTALVLLLQALCHPLLNRRSDPLGGFTAADGPFVAAGMLAWLAVSLWALCSFLRASWSALEGRRPGAACFLRLDLRALGRLLGALLTLAGLCFGAVLLLALLEAAVSLLSDALALVVALLPIPGLLYLLVSQRFLGPIALLEGPGSLATLERGRRVVDPRWGSVLGLWLVQLLVLLLGLLAGGIGVVVAVPVVACSSTAAYRQLF